MRRWRARSCSLSWRAVQDALDLRRPVRCRGRAADDVVAPLADGSRRRARAPLNDDVCAAPVRDAPPPAARTTLDARARQQYDATPMLEQSNARARALARVAIGRERLASRRRSPVRNHREEMPALADLAVASLSRRSGSLRQMLGRPCARPSRPLPGDHSPAGAAGACRRHCRGPAGTSVVARSARAAGHAAASAGSSASAERRRARATRRAPAARRAEPAAAKARGGCRPNAGPSAVGTSPARRRCRARAHVVRLSVETTRGRESGVARAPISLLRIRRRASCAASRRRRRASRARAPRRRPPRGAPGARAQRAVVPRGGTRPCARPRAREARRGAVLGARLRA